MHEKGMHHEADYTGLLSWKFNEKTNIAGSEFIEFIKKNPGHDVYFINPLPFLINAYAFRNVWYQGDFYHPGLLDFMQRIMNDLDYGIDLKGLTNDESTTLFCNYWVGNEIFWDRYMGFTKPIYDYLSTRLDESKKEFISRIADRIIGTNHIPFIFERLFSTFLSSRRDIRYLNYRYSEENLSRIPLEDKTGILLLRRIWDSSAIAERSFVTESIRVLIQQILRDRQERLEGWDKIGPRVLGIKKLLVRRKGLRELLGAFLTKIAQ
jgi:hypothetical protein